MNPPLPNKNHFIRNRLRLTRKVQFGAIILFAADEMHRNGDQFFPFRQNSDFYYFTGIEQKESALLLMPHAADSSLREVLFIQKPDPRKETWFGKMLTPDDASAASGIETIRFTEDFDQVLHQVACSTETFWFNIPAKPKFKTNLLSRDEREMKQIRERYPLHKYERISRYIEEMRLIKEDWEIEMIRYASFITVSAINRVIRKCRPGIPEKLLEAEFIYECTVNNAFPAYAPIIACGINACTLHYTSNSSQCSSGSLLLIDAGAEYNNYASDCTRTIPVSGRFSPRQKEVYNSVLRVYEECVSRLVPGKTIEQVELEIQSFWEEEHLKLGLYTKNDLKSQNPADTLFKKYTLHGISHFVGLDVHDPGSKTIPLEPNMVLTCEPGIYVPEENLGVRIENTLVITQTGNQPLTAYLPVYPSEIESFMSKK